MSNPEPPKSKNIWCKVFGLLDKLSLKDSLTRNFIFRPPKTSYSFEPTKDMGFSFKPKKTKHPINSEEIEIKAYKLYREKKDKLYMTPVIHIENKRKESDQLLIFSHGNACDLGTIYESVITLSNIIKMDILLYDYTGYGISSNKASEENSYKDIEAVISFAIGKLNQPLNKIILCGYSLGSGPTVEMATRFHSLPFIILFCPLASCISVIANNSEQYELSSKHDMFDNVGKMSKVKCDILVIHGDEDNTISSNHSRQLLNAYILTHSPLRNKAWLIEVEEANHVNLITMMEHEDSGLRKSFLTYFNEFLHDNHTNNVFVRNVSILAEVEKEIGNTRTATDDEEDKEDKNKLKKTRSEKSTEDPEETIEEIDWHYTENLKQKEENAFKESVVGRLLHTETEHLKQLWSKMSVNDLPESWRLPIDDEMSYSVTYRKALFY